MTTADLLSEVTQSLLAIMVVSGAGYALVFHPTGNNEAVTGALGVVIGWYFRKAVNTTGGTGPNAGK